MSRGEYERAVEIVASFNEDGPNNAEYLRGQVELLCDQYGYQRYGAEPREQVEADVQAAIARKRAVTEYVNPAIREALEAIWSVLPESPNRELGVFDLLADIDRENTKEVQ